MEVQKNNLNVGTNRMGVQIKILRVAKSARAASAGEMLLPSASMPKIFPRESSASVAMPRFGLRRLLVFASKCSISGSLLLISLKCLSSGRLDGRPSAATTKRKTKTAGTNWK